MVFHIIVFLAAFVAVVWGFRRGFARQVPDLIGIAFGVVSARLLSVPMTEIIYGAFPAAHGTPQEAFAYSVTARGLILALVWLVFAIVTSFIGRVLDRKERTIVNNLGGAAMGLFSCMLLLSVIFNIIAAGHPDSTLVRSVRSDDGNAVEEVMLLAPALFGGPDVDDLSHRLQLEDAKKIS